MSDSRARFEAWNESTPPRAQPIINKHTSDPNFAESLLLCIRRERLLAYQAATDAAIEQCVTLVHDKLQPLGTFEHELVAALRALKGEK